MVMEFIIIMMVRDILEIGKKVKKMVREHFFNKMGQIIKGTLKMI